MTKRSLRLRASQAEWHAREHRKNADTWWRVAGGRPADDAATPPRSPSDPAPDPVRTRDDSHPPDPARVLPGDGDPRGQDGSGRPLDPATRPRDSDDVPEPGGVLPGDRDPSVRDGSRRPLDPPTRPRDADDVPDPARVLSGDGDPRGRDGSRRPLDPATRPRDADDVPDPARVLPGDRDPSVRDGSGRPLDPPTRPRDADDVPEPGDRRVAPQDRDGPEGAARRAHDRTLDESPDFLGESDEVEHQLEGGAGDDVPAGMYRDPDGLLHQLGDRPDSYRDPDGTWHHRDDDPGTYRDDTFRLRDELNNEFLQDHLTKRPYRFLADPGPEQPYTVVDRVIAGRITKTVAERATLQAQRDKANAAVKRHMAEFGIDKISDLAEEKLKPRVQKLETAILESSLSDAEKLAKLERLAEMHSNAKEFNRLGPLLVNASKTLGELGGRAFGLDADQRPGAVLLAPFEGAIDGADTVDIAVLVPGAGGEPPKLVVIEAKGVGSQLGGSKAAEAQQGSPEYLRRTAAIDKNLRRILTETPEQMRARRVDPDSAAGRALRRAREQLLAAHRDGTLQVEYHLVHVSKDGEVTASEFKLERDGVLVRIDVIGGIESPALVRTPNQTPPATPGEETAPGRAAAAPGSEVAPGRAPAAPGEETAPGRAAADPGRAADALTGEEAASTRDASESVSDADE
ncbi:hypothetical protein [Nocardia asiatica]|uniref:hypothetical protein n=1 Tax=Nocardia asiatica TaxID=209252 RepID=UPI003EDF8923